MRPSSLQSPLRTLVFATLLFLFAPGSAHAQSQSPFLYASIPGATTSQIVGFSVGLDGTLTPITGSPFTLSREGGLVTTDPTDQYLFVLNPTSNTISVLSINPTTGALIEVSGSPVLAPTNAPGGGGAIPSDPICMATYKGKSANYLFVAYRNTAPAVSPFNGAIVAFQIGTTVPPLTPVVQTNFEATPVNIVTNPLVAGPRGYLYAALQSGPGDFSGVAVFTIDPSFGTLNPESSQGGIHLNEQSLAINPNGTFLFDGWGTTSGGIESSALLADGSLPLLPTNAVPLRGSSVPPSAMLTDGSGQLLYAQQGGQAAVYLIDQSTGALSATEFTPPFSIKLGNAVADPVEPFIYTIASGNVHVFDIFDFATGSVVELENLQQPIPNGSGGLAITHSAALQTPAPHSAALVPSTLHFDNTNVGQSVASPTVLLTNTGTEPLNIASVAITGDVLDFSCATTCPSPPSQLAAHAFCSLTFTFAPKEAGALGVTLSFTDDANPDTQSIQLTGTGVSAEDSGGSGGDGGSGSGGSGSGGSGSAGSGSSGSGSGGSGSGGSGGSGGTGNPPPSSQPTISPSVTSLVFLSTALNAPSPQQQISFTNSSASPNSVPLVISGIQIIGEDHSDFVIVNTCPQPNSYSPSQYCTISIVFTPSATGSRSAQIQITDNAVNSPQSIQLSGSTESDTLKISPADSNAFTQTISAGQTATFKLQLTATFTGTVLFSPCAGAPATATCTGPASISVNGDPSAVPFTVTVATVASSSSMISLDELRHQVIAPRDTNKHLFATAIAFALALFLIALRIGPALRAHSPLTRRKKTHAFAIPARAITAAALLAVSLFSISGCGGASTIATAPPAPTPTSESQTYTIIITATVRTNDNSPVSPATIRLTLNVN